MSSRAVAPFGAMKRRCAASIIGGLILVAVAMPALAHRSAAGLSARAGAIILPNLSHGQMRVIADYRAAIMAIAAVQDPTDSTMRRLETFINLQRFACLWGIMPGTVTDEESPFNECAHAYLAATRALLMHLRTMPSLDTEKRVLARTIEVAMLDNGASLILCRYSDEPFNTAEIIGPHWGDIPFHPVSLAACGGTTLVALALAFGAWRWGRPVREMA